MESRLMFGRIIGYLLTHQDLLEDLEHSIYPDLKVSDLLSHGSWNETLIQSIIQPEDIPHIKKIRPSITGLSDMFTWIHTKNGLYSVKSGYHVQRQLSSAHFRENTSGTLFKKIWKHNMPQKIKHFWWRCLHNALPTAENLRKRRMLTDDTCQRCGEAPENINHLLFHCRISKEIWDLTTNFHGISSSFSFSSIDKNIDLLLSLNKNQGKDASLFPFIGWRIWKTRNDFIFNNKRWSIPDTINRAILDFQQWKESYNVNKEAPKKQQVTATNASISSITQQAKEYSCFVDGSWSSPNDCAGIGWVLYNRNAQVVLSGKASISPMNSPVEVEAEALRMAILHVNRLGYANVMFCGDAELLFQQIIHMFNGSHHYHQENQTLLATYLRDIQNISSSYDSVTFVKIPRSVNVVADNLAKNARINQSSFVISWYM
ncbi:PREDICTED: uncharacterized protein LOC104733362 [Camelina sativa]|uniref:Uncharacterized protein LOC104733362 n=1 Tax=Camelina sativa TaxID=90675 RepID=A0ABM0V5T8_CAMSA|nr:PREDICTED: uncharacterized protein LOC104733362 [Camelina sativa]